MNHDIIRGPRPIREIRAVFTESTVRVYQAFGHQIAIPALENQTFVSPFRVDGITSWIKPSFLWTMARTGWGQHTRTGAQGREHEGYAKVLGIDMDRTFFDGLLNLAQLTHFEEQHVQDKRAWTNMLRQAQVLVQWDPERCLPGNRCRHKAIQMGLRSQALKGYVRSIKLIEDQTSLIAKIRHAQSREEQESLLPPEMPYPVTKDIQHRLQMLSLSESQVSAY